MSAKPHTSKDVVPLAFALSPAAAFEVRVDIALPFAPVDALVADVAHQAALRFVHHFDSFAVVHEVRCAFLVNPEVPCCFDGIDVCAEENEFPIVLLLLPFYHLLYAIRSVLVARILVAVGSDDEDGLFGAVFLAGILVHVAYVVDSASDGVEQCGATAGVVFLLGEGSDVRERYAVVEHLHLGVEKYRRDIRLALLLLLLIDGGVEAPDGVLLESAHGTAAVQDENDFGESLFHDCLRAAICAAVCVVTAGLIALAAVTGAIIDVAEVKMVAWQATF